MQDNRNIDDDLTNTCMLVSDSDEVRDQLDSKKLDYSTLVDFSEEALFKKYLDMSKYLTYNQFKAYSEMLQEKYKELNAMKRDLPSVGNYKPLFRVVDGQVILIDVISLNEYNATQHTNLSPEDYVRTKWDITSEYKLVAIPDCMLRGMLESYQKPDDESSNQFVPEKSTNREVWLENVNMPPHMHHSSVTMGANFTTMRGGVSSQSTYCNKNNTTYDVFYNDSLNIGLNKNELDGTVDKFTVNNAGTSS